MKKQILLLTSFLSLSSISFAQNEYIDVNNIKAGISSFSNMFYHRGTSDPNFEVPKGNGTHAVFAGNLWMGGMDAGSQLHLAAGTYNSGSNKDFFPGPIADEYLDANYTNRYDRVWKVTTEMINDHIANYDQGAYVMPEVIENWPAHGNEANGEANLLAPFADVNLNEVYDPENGDYPLIKGDMTLYSIFNDLAHPHTSSYSPQIGVEVHRMVYAYNTSGVLNNTLFVNYKVINRSEINYSDFYVGNWLDFDLGNPIDDYVGSDPERNLFYCYNGDNNDDVSGSGGSIGYGENPPAIGCFMLNKTLSSFVYYNHGGGPTGDPAQSNHFYNYMRAIWLDESLMCEGGNGHIDGGGNSNAPASFMFDGNPQANTGWTELSAWNQPGDRRGLGSVGPFMFNTNDTLNIDFSIVFAPGGVSNLESINTLQAAVDSIQNYYDTQFTGVKESNRIGKLEKLVVYPNPTSDKLFVKTESVNKGVVELFDIKGKRVLAKKINSALTQLDVSQLAKGIYHIHLITDGNTQIEKVIIE